MRTIELSDFDEHFDAVMDAVAQGERFVITRGGHPSRIWPRAVSRIETAASAIQLDLDCSHLPLDLGVGSDQRTLELLG